MGNLANTFRNRLAALLGGRGAKLDLARTSGFSRPSIDRWLAGGNSPDLDQVDALARALGKNPLSLLSEPGEARQAHVPEDLLRMLADTPEEHEAVRSLLMGFAIQRESEAAKRVKKSPKRGDEC